MKRSWILLVVSVVVVAAASRRGAKRRPQTASRDRLCQSPVHPAVLPACGVVPCHRTPPAWHGYYYDPAWGMPVALVVPPCSCKQVNLGWGPGSARMDHVRAKFKHIWPGPGVYDRAAFQPTPALAQRYDAVRRLLHPRAEVRRRQFPVFSSLSRKEAIMSLASGTRYSLAVSQATRTGSNQR